MPGKERSAERTTESPVVTETVTHAEVPEGESVHHLHPLRCARDFMAEVHARSTSSNIVSATFTGLRARLAPTIAQLAHRTADAAGPRAAAAPGTRPPVAATGNAQGRTSMMDNAGGSGSKSNGQGKGSTMDIDGSGSKGDGGSRQSAARKGANGDGCGEQEAVQVGRQLASQLAGLKRRAAVREYSA